MLLALPLSRILVFPIAYRLSHALILLICAFSILLLPILV
jgi:hypothetical protein